MLEKQPHILEITEHNTKEETLQYHRIMDIVQCVFCYIFRYKQVSKNRKPAGLHTLSVLLKRLDVMIRATI